MRAREWNWRRQLRRSAEGRNSYCPQRDDRPRHLITIEFEFLLRSDGESFVCSARENILSSRTIQSSRGVIERRDLSSTPRSLQNSRFAIIRIGCKKSDHPPVRESGSREAGNARRLTFPRFEINASHSAHLNRSNARRQDDRKREKERERTLRGRVRKRSALAI